MPAVPAGPCRYSSDEGVAVASAPEELLLLFFSLPFLSLPDFELVPLSAGDDDFVVVELVAPSLLLLVVVEEVDGLEVLVVDVLPDFDDGVVADEPEPLDGVLVVRTRGDAVAEGVTEAAGEAEAVAAGDAVGFAVAVGATLAVGAEAGVAAAAGLAVTFVEAAVPLCVCVVTPPV